MLWLWLLLRRQYTARTGVLPFDCPFACARCGAQCPSRVFAEGFGTWTSTSGSNPNGYGFAHQVAVQNYHGAVRSAFASAACPACGKFAPTVTSQADHEGGVRAEAERSRYTWAAIAAAVVLIGALGGALYDRSGFLALAGVCGAGAAGIIALYLRTPSVANVRLVHPRNVVFWWNGDWFAPAASYAPAEDATHARSKTFSLLATLGALVLGAGAITGLGMWGLSFHTLYVVNTQTRGAMHVSIDGQPVGDVAQLAHGATDAASRSFMMRAGPHVLEAFDDDGQSLERRDLEVGRLDNTWFFAPRARANGACLVRVVSSYSKYGTAAEPVVTIFDDTLFSSSVDDVLVGSPSSVMLDNNQSETKRTAVRALVCSRTNADGEGTPFSVRGR
jgi:hypothetical protein